MEIGASRVDGIQSRFDEELWEESMKVLGVPRKALAQRSKNSMTRPMGSYAVCQYTGCTQRTAADVLGLSSGAAVSFQLKKRHDLLSSDKALQAILEKLKKQLCVRSL